MPGAILSVRFTSQLSEEKVREVMKSRTPEFLKVPGLLQKFYGKEEDEPNTYTGIYIFDSMESLDAYRASDLAKSIPSAYDAIITKMRRERYELIMPLKPQPGLSE